MDAEVNDVLIGAEQLRNMIHNALVLGEQNIYSNSYQIKSRVKDKLSFIEKVKSRHEEGRTDYSPQSVTDVVGFRFINLFQHELLYLVELFTDFVEDFQKKPAQLFWGDKLKDCMKEVIVYQSNVTETVYQSIYEFLQGRFASRGFPKDFVKLRQKESLYSSIHFVIYGNIVVAGEAKAIPVEFQIRTALEDVWGEMQHQLLYKNANINRKTQEGIDRYNEGSDLLRLLKTYLDNCSEHARIAYVKLYVGSAAEQSKQALATHLSSVLEGVEDLLGATAVADTNSVRKHVIGAYEAVHSGLLNADADKVRKLFEDVLTRLEAFFGKWVSPREKDDDSYIRLLYAIDMERAAANYWIGVAVSRSENDGHALGSADKYFEASRQIYFGLTKFGNLTNDPVLNFRIAQIYRKLRRTDLSIAYYEAAYEGMQDPDWKDKGSVFEIQIPRHLAFMLWSRAESALRKHAGLSKFETPRGRKELGDPIEKKYRDSLREAFNLSKKIDDAVVDKISADVVDVDQEKAIAFNNSLWYATEYFELFGEKIGEDDGEFTVEYYNRIDGYRYFDNIEDLQIQILDTFVRAAMHFDDRERGGRWLSEMDRRLQAPEWNRLEEEVRERILVTMDRARHWLGGLRGPVGLRNDS